MAEQKKIQVVPGLKLVLKSKGKKHPQYIISVKKKQPLAVRLSKNIAFGAGSGAVVNAATAALMKKITGMSRVSPKDAAVIGALAGGLGGLLKTGFVMSPKALRNAWAGGGAALGGLTGYATSGKKATLKTKIKRTLGGATLGGMAGYLAGPDSRPKFSRAPPPPPPGPGGGGGYSARSAYSSTGHVPRPSWAKGATTQREAKSAFRRQARANHPDFAGGSTEKMKDINEQWDNFVNSDTFRKMKKASLLSFWSELETIVEEMHFETP